MPLTLRSRRRLSWALLLAGSVGCNGSATDDGLPLDPSTVKLAPVSGTVTLNHKPLVGAVVAFMPPQGATSVGETDKDGRFELESYGGREGAPPGKYKVAISYLVSAGGEPQGLGARSTLSSTAARQSATERLPPEYSDLGRSKLKATVGAAGGAAFNFDLDVAAESLEGKAATKADRAPNAGEKAPPAAKAAPAEKPEAKKPAAENPAAA